MRVEVRDLQPVVGRRLLLARLGHHLGLRSRRGRPTRCHASSRHTSNPRGPTCTLDILECQRPRNILHSQRRGDVACADVKPRAPRRSHSPGMHREALSRPGCHAPNIAQIALSAALADMRCSRIPARSRRPPETRQLGRVRGAGRKCVGPRPNVPHCPRGQHDARHSVHLTPSAAALPVTLRAGPVGEHAPDGRHPAARRRAAGAPLPGQCSRAPSPSTDAFRLACRPASTAGEGEHGRAAVHPTSLRPPPHPT